MPQAIDRETKERKYLLETRKEIEEIIKKELSHEGYEIKTNHEYIYGKNCPLTRQQFKRGLGRILNAFGLSPISSNLKGINSINNIVRYTLFRIKDGEDKIQDEVKALEDDYSAFYNSNK